MYFQSLKYLKKSLIKVEIKSQNIYWLKVLPIIF